MILVTLGTQDKEFKRLIKIVEKAKKNNIIKDKVIVQAGFTKYKSKYLDIFDFCSNEKLEKLVKECDLLITHAGVGSIISGISKNKKVIACPRLAKYREHTNDHQLQILKKFSDAGYILSLNEKDKFESIYKNINKFKPKKYVDNSKKIVDTIDNYLKSLKW